MKNIRLNIYNYICVLIAVLCLSSCAENDKKDDNDDVDFPVDKVPTSILGTWRYDWGDDSDYDYTMYHFGKEGEGACWDKGNGGERFKYTYDKNVNMVEIEWNEYYTEKMPVTFLKSNSLMLEDQVYKSTKLSYEHIILGVWLLNVRKGENSWSNSIVRFNTNKSFEIKDEVQNTPIYSSWDQDEDVKYGEYYIEGDMITFTGDSDIAGKYIIDALVINGCRLIRAETPNEYPRILGGWYNR